MTEPRAIATPVGFLFTDIEGSTRLWEAYPAAMAVAQTRHDTLLRHCIERNGGELYRSAGDSVQAAFPDGASAVRAAIEAQTALSAADWGTPNGLRVRMAIHVTHVERTPGGDYRSPQLDLLGALLSLAHGGQILLTSDAAKALHGGFPDGSTLTDLGSWRLPAINRSEHTFQVRHAALDTEFPPFVAPRVEDAADRARLDRFVGRRGELKELHALLDRTDVRLITLTGPGGIGKTRLAQQLAIELLEVHATHVWFVELVGLTEAEQVLPVIASVLGVPETGPNGAFGSVVESLRDRSALLMLDNFEHLLSAAGEITLLLAQLPDLKVLVTSRGPLRIRGEWQVPIEPLSLPPAVVRSWQELDASESVQLFNDRVMEVDAAFKLGERNATAVIEIRRKLEGIPLAIELAAPLVRVLSMDELNDRLNDRLALLAGEVEERDGRHRAIRASIAWSYELLDPGAKGFFRQLGLLQSGFTLETLDGLLGDRFDTLTEVERLIEQNLVHLGRFQRQSDRFALLESVRQFALDELEAAGELASARERHARYFANRVLARHADQRSINAAAVAAFALDLDDLRQAILWLIDHDLIVALKLGEGAWRIWYVCGRIADVDRWQSLLLAATEDVASISRVRVLYGRALGLYTKGELEQAIELDRASLALATELDDARGIGDACNHLAGMISYLQGTPEEPRALVERALEIYATIDDRHGRAESLLNRAAIAVMLGDYEATLRDGLEVVEYCRAEGKDVLASNTIVGVAESAFQLGNKRLAVELLARSTRGKPAARLRYLYRRQPCRGYHPPPGCWTLRGCAAALIVRDRLRARTRSYGRHERSLWTSRAGACGDAGQPGRHGDRTRGHRQRAPDPRSSRRSSARIARIP